MTYIIGETHCKELSQDAIALKGYEKKISGSEFFFFEWGLAMSEDIIPLVNALNKISEDNLSYLADLMIIEDSSILPNYVEGLGQYPIIEFSSPISNDLYVKEITKEFLIDRFVVYPKTGPLIKNFSMWLSCEYIHFSPSKLWRIYSESYYELGVLETAVGFPEGITFPRILDGKTRDEAFEECRPSFRPKPT
jgi:hypothetical protein